VVARRDVPEVERGLREEDGGLATQIVDLDTDPTHPKTRRFTRPRFVLIIRSRAGGGGGSLSRKMVLNKITSVSQIANPIDFGGCQVLV
jgi:hypothetical protein